MKIILWIILILLALGILLLLTVLLVPIRYRIHAQKYEAVNGKIQISWLIHLVSVLLLIEGGKVTAGKVRICGLTLVDLFPEKKAAEETEKQEADSKKDEADPVPVMEEKGHENMPVPKQNISKIQEKKKKKKKKNKKRRRLFERIAHQLKRLCTAIDRGLDRLDEAIDVLAEKTEQLSETISKYYDFAADESVRIVFRRVVNILTDFVTYILPVRLKGELRIGMSDPAATGQLCAVLAMLLPWYGENFVFRPDFEQQVVEGEIFCRGRIRLGHFVRKVIWLICHRDFWYVVKRLKRIFRKSPVSEATK